MESGTILAIIALVIGLVGHVITTVWWASRITTILELTQKSMETLSVEMKAVNKTYVSKEDLARELVVNEKEHAAMWKQIDNMK